MKDKSRALRRQSTRAERLLWHHLRNRNVAGYKFRRQHVVGPYIADFACPTGRLIVEIDGGQHAEQRGSDARRTLYLEGCGYHVVRFWNTDVLQNIDGVLTAILAALTPTMSQGKGGGH